jgi:hypothetical protein
VVFYLFIDFQLFIYSKACLNGSNIVGPTSSNNVTIIDMTASLSNLFGSISFTQTLNLVLTKIFEKEAVWAIISTMLDDVGPTMLDPFNLNRD